MNDDFRYMKFIYLHCGEETKLREIMNDNFRYMKFILLGRFIWTQHIDQLPVGLVAQLVEL